MQGLVDLGGHAIEMDVTDEQQTIAAVARIVKEQGRIVGNEYKSYSI